MRIPVLGSTTKVIELSEVSSVLFTFSISSVFTGLFLIFSDFRVR